MRKNPLVTGEYYHIFNRSIAKFQIFNCEEDFERFINLIDFYRYKDLPDRYSNIIQLKPAHYAAVMKNLHETGEIMVELVAYCVMPTHFHLILKQVENNGISEFIRKVSDSYTRYFNILHGRKGPLWEDHFKNKLIKTDEYLLHLSRYIHLNPVSAGIIKKPNQWEFSSYAEYINKKDNGLCQFKNTIDMPAKKYKKFVLDRISYQKEISMIKYLLFDDYSG